MADLAASIPRVRTQGLEAVGETAFALLDALWLGPVGIAVFDRELRFQQVNEALAALHGVAPAQHAGRTLGDLFAPTDPAVVRVEAAMRDAIATARPVLNVAIVGALPDGTPREWLCSYYPVIAAGGEARGVCALVMDATDDRAREAGLVQARIAAERAARRLALLQNVTAALAAAADPEEVAEVFVAEAPALLEARTAVVRVEEDGALRILAERGLPPDIADRPPIPLTGAAPVAAALRRAEPLFLGSPDALASRSPGSVADARRLGDAWAVLPLGVRGHSIGTLSLSFDHAREFDLEERGLMLSLAEQCAQALERAHLRRAERELRARAETANDRVRRLQAVTAALSQARTAEDVGAAMVLQAHEALGVSTALALVRSADGEALQVLASLGFDAPRLAPFEGMRVDTPVPVAEAVRTGEPVFVPSVAEARERYPMLDDFAPAAIRGGAVVACPLRAGGAVIGALTLGFSEPRRFDPEQRAILLTVADQCAQAMERALLFDAERRARAVLAAVLENAPVGIGFWDPAFRFKMLNQLLADMNGIPVEEHLGKTARELLPNMPVDEIEALWTRILRTGAPVLDFAIEGETPAAPGKRRHWKESFYPVRADGEALGIGAIVREVTAEREAEEFQKNVLGIVSHDLRNPLSTMVLSARLLGRRDGGSSEVKELTRRIVRSAERMERIVEVLLDYTRVRSGQGIPIRPVECRLDSILLGLVEETEAVHPGRRVGLQVDGDAAGHWDPARLTQVVANLLGNAVRHSPPGAIIEAGVRGTEDEAALWIRNEGPPIPADVLPRLFEPFRRAGAEGPPGREGLGLGLFIARAIVDAHGGRIEARSEDGEGTVFTVRLPRRGANRTVLRARD
jgi:PAS domain S-box-containing protein